MMRVDELIYYTDSDPDGKLNQPVMVLLHGFFMDGRMFKHQLEYFKSNHRVICCDFRGFGKTKWSKSEFTLDDLVDDILTLLSHLHISSCVLVGMSMGGYVAQRLLLKRVDLVSHLVLIATQAGCDNPETITAYHQLRDAWANHQVRDEIIDSLLPIIIGDDNEETRFWKAVWREYHYDDIYHSMTAMTSRNSIDLSCINTPCLIIHGRFDRGIPLCAAEALNRVLQHSKLVIIDSECHAINLIHGQVVNDEINSFIINN
ncbi:TPA: alpha/beta hydrolase [Aeromonas hydrophila]|nr:alpha/beta hydrolase [Aeromonas hydrophila]